MASFSQLPFPQADTEGRCSLSSYYSEGLRRALVVFCFLIRKDLKETSRVALISLNNVLGDEAPPSPTESLKITIPLACETLSKNRTYKDSGNKSFKI